MLEIKIISAVSHTNMVLWWEKGIEMDGREFFGTSGIEPLFLQEYMVDTW